MAEKVMIELVGHGIGRDESHEILRSASFEAIANGWNCIHNICIHSDDIS